MTVLLAALAAVLFATGTWMLLHRRLTSIIIGIGLLGHGANLLLVTAGDRGDPPILGADDGAKIADPLPQALALTAIVITFGVTLYLLAMAFRRWQLVHDDLVEVDREDRDVGVRRDDEAYAPASSSEDDPT